MPARRSYTPALLTTLLIACGSQPPASSPPPAPTVSLTPPQSTAPASAAPDPPDPNEPIEIRRAGNPAPWIEPESTPLNLWEPVALGGPAVRMINPILGDTPALAIEPGAIVLRTRVGDLVITRDGVRGLTPKGVRFVGVLASGEVLAEDSARAPLQATNIDAFVAGKLTPIAGIQRVLDAAGTHVAALRDQTLIRSDNGGKTFTDLPLPLPTKRTVERAFVRGDGVVLAGVAEGRPDATWFTVSAKGRVEPVRRALREPMRLGGFIMADLKRSSTQEAQSADVLTRDGRAFARINLPTAVQGAEYISFHPVFLGAPTEGTRPWEGDAIAQAPLKPPPKKRALAGSIDEDEGGIVGGVVGGVFGLSGPPKEDPCRGLRCIAKLRPIIPGRDAANVVARFFDDGLCKGPVNGKCKSGPLLRAPTIGLFNRKTRALTFHPTPPACEPLMLESFRGLVILDCRGDRYVSDASGAFAREGPVNDAREGSWDYVMADDGTLLVERVDSGHPVDAYVRLPVAPGAGNAWRQVTKPSAVAHVVLPGGAVMVATSSDAGDKLGLILDAPEGVTTLVASVPVARPVRNVVVKEGYPELVFADDEEPPAARVSRGGALLPAPR